MERIWYKQYPPDVPKTIDPDVYSSLIEPLEKFCKQYADLPAFSNLGTKITYSELDTLSLQFATYLQHSLKLQKGARVAIMMPNLLQYPIALFGILRAGLVVVNINPLYTAPELEHLLKDSEVETIIVLANFAHTVEKVQKNTPLKHIIITEVGDLMGMLKGSLVNLVVKYIKRMVPSWNIPQAQHFSKALALGSQHTYQRPILKGEDIAFLQYTGGTTGYPKAAILTHRNMVANMLQCAAWVKSVVRAGEDVVLCALPLYHIFSLTVCCMTFLVLGAECLLITNPRDMPSFIKTLKKVPVSIFVGLNTLFNGLLRHRDFKNADFSRLKLTVAGGMAVQASVAEAWKRATGVCVLQGYGLTETSPVVSISPVDLTDYNESIGLPVSSTDVVIRNEAGQDVSADQDGELCVHGPQVMQGYWKQPEATSAVLDKDGWLRTGDIARMDKQGFLYIVDRKKDMILVSGFNVYPNEIEEVLSTHPGIEEAAVIGIPSEKTGEAVKACIVRSDLNLTKEDVIAFCKQSLTAYKIPKTIEFLDALPKSTVGKVLRRALRDDAGIQ